MILYDLIILQLFSASDRSTAAYNEGTSRYTTMIGRCSVLEARSPSIDTYRRRAPPITACVHSPTAFKIQRGTEHAM